MPNYRRCLRQIFLGVFFPPRCPVCDDLLEQADAVCAGGDGIHPRCVHKLTWTQEPVCCHCGRPLEKDAEEYCFDCSRLRKETVTFQQAKALLLYRGDAKKMMYRFKYSNRREYGDFFAMQAAKRYGKWFREIGAEAIMPVPMFPVKKRRRGYNQAETFARALAEELGIAYEAGILRRIRNTKPLKELNDAQRRENLKNAFQIKQMGVKYKKILVVDDIYTTGSTANEIARILRQSGVENVYFFFVCIGQGA